MIAISKQGSSYTTKRVLRIVFKLVCPLRTTLKGLGRQRIRSESTGPLVDTRVILHGDGRLSILTQDVGLDGTILVWCR